MHIIMDGNLMVDSKQRMINFLWNDSVLNWERKSANTSLITNTDFLYVNTIYTLNSIFNILLGSDNWTLLLWNYRTLVV